MLYIKLYNIKINGLFQIRFFQKKIFYTHKNDYMFYSASVEGQSVKVFVTKSYKLVKINFNSEYIFDFEDFITLLASSICKKNICKKLGFKRNFNFTFKRTNFKISYKNFLILNCSYTKSVQMLKALNSLFFSLVNYSRANHY